MYVYYVRLANVLQRYIATMINVTDDFQKVNSITNGRRLRAYDDFGRVREFVLPPT